MREIGRNREKKRSFVSWFSPQIAMMLGGGLGQTQEQELPPGCHVDATARALGPFAAVLPGPLAWSWVRSGTVGTRAGSHMPALPAAA